jgi:hypothetical protein
MSDTQSTFVYVTRPDAARRFAWVTVDDHRSANAASVVRHSQGAPRVASVVLRPFPRNERSDTGGDAFGGAGLREVVLDSVHRRELRGGSKRGPQVGGDYHRCGKN